MDSRSNLKPNSSENKNNEDVLFYNYKTRDSSDTDVIFFEEASQTLEILDKFSSENQNSFLNKILKKPKKFLEKQTPEKTKTLIITEQKLFEKFQAYIRDLSEHLNLNVFLNFVEKGDFFKQASEVQRIHEYLLENNFEKNSIIIGLGGGKITDLAGFIASTYFRGVSLILIPTNLLAMVDASIGGKTGINHYRYGKNVIGTISQPNTILINLWMLSDLPTELISDGMAEIIKICALIDSESFQTLKQNNITTLKSNKKLFHSIIKKNIKQKINIISQDAKDAGFRNILNFGHTVGHAIESLEAFNLSHGKSVAIGLCAEAQLAAMLKRTPEQVLFEIKEVLETYLLPTEIPNFILDNVHEFIEKFKVDKKNSNEKIRFVYVCEIGKICKQQQRSCGFFLSLEKSALLKHFSKRIYIDIQKQIDYVYFEKLIINEKEKEIENKKYENFSPEISNEKSNTDLKKTTTAITNDNNDKKIIKLKGSKSICNRSLILAALGKGKVQLENFLFSEDTIVMIKCLKQLGIPITIASEDSIIVEGSGTENFKNKNVNLFVENAGTAARFLTGFCLLFKNSIITIDGIARMRERPIDDLLDCILETQEFKNDENKFDCNSTGEREFKYFNDLFHLEEKFCMKNFHQKNFSIDLLNDQKRVCFQQADGNSENENNRILLKNNFEIVYLKGHKKMPFCIVTSQTGFQLKNENTIKLKSKKSSQFVSSLLLISPFIEVKFDECFDANAKKDKDFNNGSKSKNLQIVLTDLEEIEAKENLNENKNLNENENLIETKTSEITIKNSVDKNFKSKKYKKPVSYQYIEMTLKMMEIWGIKVNYNCEAMDKYILEKFCEAKKEEKNKSFCYLNPPSYKIEPDASTANFFLAHVALNGGNILLDSIGSKSIQGDSKFFEFLKKIRTDFIECIIQDHSISIAAEKLNFNNKNENENKTKKVFFNEDISIITDSFLALGVVCSQIPGEYYLRGIENQAIKECNRLEIFCKNLNAIGVYSTILPCSDGIYINSTAEFTRKNNINSVEIQTENDHRVAMSFAILANFLQNTCVYIDNKNCVNKTYPEFWSDFERFFGLKYAVDEFNGNRSVFRLKAVSFANKPVFIVGMRSCGKTSFGKAAARKLNFAFYDLDDMLVEKVKGRFGSIKEIVQKEGWEFFRSLERQLFMEIYRESYKYSRAVIACGGGIVENEEILIALKTVGNVVFIDTPLENIEEYIKVIEEIKIYKKNVQWKSQKEKVDFDVINNNSKDDKDTSYNNEDNISKKNNFEGNLNDNRPAYAGNKDFKQVYNERLSKYKYVAKYVFKTPFINDIKEFIEMFESYKSNCALVNTNLEESQTLKNLEIQEKIESGISNFKTIVDLIGDIFANFVYTTCNPMKFPVPHDNSYFLCAQVNEDLLSKIALAKKFFNKLTDKNHILESLLTKNNISIENNNNEKESSNQNKIVSIINNEESLTSFLKSELKFNEDEITNLLNFLKINFAQYNAVELRFDYLLQTLLNPTQNEKNNSMLLINILENMKLLKKNSSFSNFSCEAIADLFASIIQEFRYISLNKTPILFTIRSNDQGGFLNFNNYSQEYKKIKKQILKYGIEYIDIEFRKENINFIQEFYTEASAKLFNTSVILSNHFFDAKIKNNLAHIKKSVFTMSLLHCDVLKIITNFDSFSLNKIEFLELKVFVDDLIKKPLIFFQLGEGDGKLSRLANSFFLPVFDPNLAKPTGKGQLSIEEIEGFKSLLFQGETKKLLEYKVIGTNVAFSPSPLIYFESVQWLKKQGKLQSGFDVEFGYRNINYDEWLKATLFSCGNNNNINDDDKVKDNLKMQLEEKLVKDAYKKTLYDESGEFYNLIFNNNNLLFASITIPFKTLLNDLHYGKSTNYNDNSLKRDNNYNISISNNKTLAYDKNKLIFSEETLKMNSVNCIKKINIDRIMCFNTDWIGNYEIIVELLQKINKNLSEIKILVLGAGGAANAVIFSLKQFNFLNENIFIENRSKEKALLLAKKFNLNVLNFAKEKYESKEKFDIVISTIPKDCETEILEALLDNVCECTVLVDLAYTKPASGISTNFKKILGTKSDHYVDGILFLLKQAYYSFELFYAKICPRERLEEVFLKMQK